MRKTTLVLNAIVIVFFILFLAYTLIARQHLQTLARGFVTEKTLAYSRPIVEVANESLDSPLIKKFLSEDQTNAIRGEIAEYRNDPGAYVADVTGQQVRGGHLPNKNPLVEKVAAIKNKVRTFYDNTLDALLRDLRIFSISNTETHCLVFLSDVRCRALLLVHVHRRSEFFPNTLSDAHGLVVYCLFVRCDCCPVFRLRSSCKCHRTKRSTQVAGRPQI